MIVMKGLQRLLNLLFHAAPGQVVNDHEPRFKVALAIVEENQLSLGKQLSGCRSGFASFKTRPLEGHAQGCGTSVH